MIRKSAKDILARASWTLLACSLTVALLIVPDISFGPMQAQPWELYDTEGWISVIVVGICLALIGSSKARLCAIAFVALGQIIWLGYYAFFGDTLRPEQLMVFVFEVDDTANGIWAHFGRLLPPTLVILTCSFLLYVTHLWLSADNRSVRVPGVEVILILALIIAAGVWSFGGDRIVRFAGANSASVTATYHNLISAARFVFSAPAGSASPLEQQKYTLLQRSSEPVTVLVILGESINPRRMSMLGAPYDTTPRLKQWLNEPPPGFAISARFGFSMGVGTLASMPSLIRVAPTPVGALQRGVNLFQIAQKSGMKSSFLSAQKRYFLDTAGGAPGASLVETVDNNRSRFAEIGDDFMLEYLEHIASDSAPRQFVFMHQRVNHSPYTPSCQHVAEQVNIFTAANRPEATDPREIDYDNGLRCWDRDVARYVEAILKRPGAVYIFVTADHNEFMGERGLWTHLHPTLDNALVPFVLLTNRPESPVQQLFDDMPAPSFFHLSRAIARAMDVDLAIPESLENRFYVNRTLPFGVAGFMEAQQRRDWTFDVRSFDASGKEREKLSIDLQDVAAKELQTRSLISHHWPKNIPRYVKSQLTPQ